MLALAGRSAWHRRFVLSLVVASIALSTFLLLAVERVRADVREGFAQSVSGTDLIVGPRGGPVQLLLHTVFNIGAPIGTMQWASAQWLASLPAVAWSVPLALGDSYRGFPVLATTHGYFEHFRHGDAQPLLLAHGRLWQTASEAVLGADVASRLKLSPGDRITLGHGDGAMAENDHADHPFEITGVLQRTGTPVDRAVHIGLQAMAALHADDFADGAATAVLPGSDVQAALPVTAVLIGLQQRAAVFGVQRDVGAYRNEPLMAILPGVALDELWHAVDVGERALRAVSVLLAVVSLFGLAAVLLAGLEQRRRELAILRAVGARPVQIVQLLVLEGLLLSLAGALLGAALLWIGVALFAQPLRLHTGLSLSLRAPGAAEVALIGGILAAGTIASLIPARRAYRLSLADGLVPRT